jgi:hypothetical protein
MTRGYLPLILFRAAGRDHLTQTELAVRAVLQAKPGMTAPDALTAVNLARRPHADQTRTR